MVARAPLAAAQAGSKYSRCTESQFPDLQHQISACCRKLGVATEPEAYLLQMNGSLNAFAELGHIRRKHLTWSTVLLPASVLPLVGAAYSRSREYTCDRHGMAACDNAVNAEHGLAALAAGGKRSRTMNNTAYIAQSAHTEGFWMSFHELVGDYPWLVKRMAAVRALAAGQEVQQPRRHFGAAVLALFVPRLGVGGAGGALMMVAVIGMLAAIGIPAYQAYVHKAQVSAAYSTGHQATAAVENYFAAHQAVPKTLADAGIEQNPGGDAIKLVQLNPENGVVRVTTNIASAAGPGALTFTPSLGEDKRIAWACSADNIIPAALPQGCR